MKRFIVDYILEPLLPHRRLESSLVFWARLVFRLRRPFIIAVTGSVGKSTTTAMIAAVLSDRNAQQVVGPVGFTVENMNDDLGLSATLLRYRSFLVLPWAYPSRLALLCRLPFRAFRVVTGRYPKVMVLECGVGSTADLHRQVTIAPPNVSVVTRIGPAHLETLRTLEGVAREKSALVRAASGLVILGQEHDYVSQLERLARAPVVKVAGSGLDLSKNITRAVCRHLEIPEEVVNSALKEFKVPDGRLSRLEFAGMTIIDDTYNANPLSMKLGLDTLATSARADQRRVAILGFMAELGEESPRYHEEVGAYARSRADVLIGVGELSKHYKPDIWLESSDSCAERIESLLCSDDCVLVKGSFSARMARVTEKLREIAERRVSVVQ